MSISIPSELEEFIRREVASGRYVSADAVVSEGILLLQRREQHREALRRDVHAAIEQIERGEYSEYDSESLRGFFDELKSNARRSFEETQSEVAN